jgi:hypothetical protein
MAAHTKYPEIEALEKPMKQTGWCYQEHSGPEQPCTFFAIYNTHAAERMPATPKTTFIRQN